jgi:hypothetical protein
MSSNLHAECPGGSAVEVGSMPAGVFVGACAVLMLDITLGAMGLPDGGREARRRDLLTLAMIYIMWENLSRILETAPRVHGTESPWRFFVPYTVAINVSLTLCSQLLWGRLNALLRNLSSGGEEANPAGGRTGLRAGAEPLRQEEQSNKEVQ